MIITRVLVDDLGNRSFVLFEHGRFAQPIAILSMNEAKELSDAYQKEKARADEEEAQRERRRPL